jgi:hypothetical protein
MDEEFAYHGMCLVPISLAGIIKNQGGISRARVNPISWIMNPNIHISYQNIANNQVILDYLLKNV